MTQDDKLFQLASRFMYVAVRFDRESFEALRETLRNLTAHPSISGEESATHRLQREALLRVFEQIRDMRYNDG